MEIPGPDREDALMIHLRCNVSSKITFNVLLLSGSNGSKLNVLAAQVATLFRVDTVQNIVNTGINSIGLDMTQHQLHVSISVKSGNV